MISRSDLADRFLDASGWGGSLRTALAGDASNRRYERILGRNPDRRAVLMDAPADRGEGTDRFVALASYFRNNGLSAPEILAQDPDNGFLLLEDLGDDLFSELLKQEPELELQLYEAATDLLVSLSHMPHPTVTAYSPEYMADLACTAFADYAAPVSEQTEAGIVDRFRDEFTDLLTSHMGTDRVLAHRDYHAENLIWLPDRTGIARVGLLDFQDAFLGHPAYDLVSLLQDIRRDVSRDVVSAMFDRYVAATGQDVDTFRAAYAIIGAQRALRILGVFGRLARQPGRPKYARLLPAVWARLNDNLGHPALSPLAGLIRTHLPEPTPDVLGRLQPS